MAFLTPKGDRGLLGPDSVAWTVHADFISMMIGGISSLILQALHPQALAGVWDHSSFRQDLRGRLGRTAFFIAATTYGPTKMAHQVIEKVNAIHAKISGVDEFGRPYSATDPRLLAWVHLTETLSFMNSFEVYRTEKINPNQRDQYFLEMTLIGEKMGATRLPTTYGDTRSVVESYIPELHFGDRAKCILNLLENFPSGLSTRPLIKLMSHAGFLNLPDWVYPIIGRRNPSPLERLAVRKSIEVLAHPIRDALKDGVAAHSLRRVYG